MSDPKLPVGPTRYATHGGWAEFGRYASGEIAIIIKGDDGEALVKASVSLVPYGAEDPGEFGLWIKDWSENEGVADALVRSGIVQLTGKTHKINFVEAKHAELTDVGRAALQQSAAA